MKINKEQEKELTREIRNSIKKKGYKMKSQSIFFKKANDFINCVYIIVNHEKISYRLSIKDYDYDEIFWNIMQMTDNSKEPLSFRACGAFVAPSVLIKKGEIELSDEYLDQADSFIELIEKCTNEFTDENNVDDYVLDLYDGFDIKILKCLAYIHIGKESEAIKLAQNFINNGDYGRFENEGKGFFEWLIHVYS